jgi:hypothetical protein
VTGVRATEPARTVPQLLTHADLAALQDEAKALRVEARRRHREGFQLVDGWQLLGPVNSASADGGDWRPAIHRRMAARFDELVHPGLHPTVSSYLYYEPGDFIGLHLDQGRCQYDVLVVLDGVATPLCVHPELTGVAPDRLPALAAGGVSEPGMLVRLGIEPVVLAGRATPHHRPPHPGPDPLVLAAFCFGPTEDPGQVGSSSPRT